MVAVSMAMSATLLWAGLEKVRSPGSFASVLRQLHVPERAVPVLATLVIAAELGGAAGLVLYPSPVVLVAVGCLAAAFACAGWIALRLDEPIRCGCFGPDSSRPLGRDQLYAFPLWLAGVALLWPGGGNPSVARGEWLASAVALTIAAIRVAAGVRAAGAASGDRRSAREMLLWLSR